jgi:MscS family membrane protein
MLDWLKEALTYQVLGIEARRYLIAFAILFAALLVRKIIQAIVSRGLKRFTEKTRTSLDDMLLPALTRPVGLAVLAAGLLAAVLVLGLPEEANLAVINIFKVIFAAIGIWLAFGLIDSFSGYFAALAGKTESKLDDQLVPLLRKTTKAFIAVIAFVLIVQNMGYSVSGLIAGLGLGGLAFALAAKDTVSNLFGSAMIFTDRPFQVGDWIKTTEVEGVVEEVGFRSTKIRTFAKTLVTVPNSMLANLAIDNFSAMPKRRVKMTVGVTYETTAEQMEQAVEAIKKLLREHEAVDQEFFLVSFTDFGASSLDILIYYFTKTTVWAEYLQARQEINLAIMRALEGLGLSIAFPSMAVYMQQVATGTQQQM